MDARTLYRQGVIAIRDQKDLARGRELLLQSLQQDPHNATAWLWLARTVQDRAQRLEYVERALSIDPTHEQALKLRERLLAEPTPAAPVDAAHTAKPSVIRPIGPRTVAVPPSPAEKERIARLMEKADIYLAANDAEAAVQQWVEVLSIRVDHELALRNAAGHLWRLRYWDDAKELVRRAIDAGTLVPSIYLTALDMVERQGNPTEAEALRERIATLPAADEQLLVSVADYYSGRFQTDQALRFMQQAVETHPDSQKLLIKLADLLQGLERPQEALAYYDRAVRLGARTKEGKTADKKLASYVPVLTDRERGSIWLAVRETLGVGALFLLMGWQDAGLSLLEMGPRRWAGMFLSLIGGYLLVTATSSPQQRPLAAWFGGIVPPPDPQPNPASDARPAPGRALQDPTHLPILSPDARTVLGLAGVVLLVLAFILVFHQSILLVRDNPPPYLPW